MQVIILNFSELFVSLACIGQFENRRDIIVIVYFACTSYSIWAMQLVYLLASVSSVLSQLRMAA